MLSKAQLRAIGEGAWRPAVAGSVGAVAVLIAWVEIQAGAVSDWINSQQDLAAWVQAVGSVIAIAAAIAIDRSTARRARVVREEHEKRAVEARLSAIRRIEEATSEAAERFMEISRQLAAGVAILDIIYDKDAEARRPHPYDRIDSARRVLSAYAHQPSELEPGVIAALLNADALVELMSDRLSEIGSPYELANGLAILSALSVTSDGVRKVLADYDAGRW